jgi:hypothetical protein
MLRTLGRYSTSFLLIIIGLSGYLSSAEASAPVITSAKYLDAENALEFVFDQPVLNDSLYIIRGGITLDGDNGGKNPDLTLSGGFISGDAVSQTIRMGLKYRDQQIIEVMPDRESLELVLSKNVFINESMEGNEPIGIEDDLGIEYIVDENIPGVVSAVYDAGINVLTIEFDKPVNGRQVELTKILIDDDDGGANFDVKFNSLNERVNTLSMAPIMQISLSPKHQQNLESFNTANLTLLLNAFAFLDENRNSCMVLDVANSVKIDYTADDAPTTLQSAEYDASKNNLTLVFNEKVITTFWDQSAVKFEEITIHDVSAAESIKLSGAAAVSVQSDVQMTIMVLPADQRLIENLKNKETLRVTINDFAILDESGNGIRAYTLDDNIQVTYIEEDEKDAPTITEATYDAITNILSLTFGNITPSTKGIDTTNVSLTGITLDDDNGGSDPDVILSGGSIEGIQTGVPKFIRILEITVTAEDEAKIETFAQKNQITIGVEPLSFFFESYTKTRNGNHLLPIGGVAVTYIPDSLAAEVTYVKYDFIENLLQLQFDKQIDLDIFRPTGLVFGDTRLTGGEFMETGSSQEVNITLTEGDRTEVNELGKTTRTDLALQVDAGNLQNLDGIGNEQIVVTDGDTTSTGDTVLVSYGRGFWDRGFEAFPEADRFIQTTLRAVGEHCYIYVADDEWPIHVNRAKVDSLLMAFENETPAYPDKGIYQIVTETFGEYGDSDGDPRINIVLINVRDEFGRGFQQRYADLPKPGYYDTRDLLPASEEAHSNEADILYIDAYPIFEAGTQYNALADIFQRMIALNEYPDEEQWLVECLSNAAQIVCGYHFTDYKYPASLPSVPFNNSLVYWTGWLAGAPSDLYDLHNAYLFTLYLYEQYGGMDIIKSIAADTASGLARIQNGLTNSNHSVTVGEVFDDYAVACLRDQLNHPQYGNKYGFAATDLGIPGQAFIEWDTDEWWDSENQYSFKYFKLKVAKQPDILLINGNDQSEFSFQMLTAVDDFVVSVADVDEKAQGQLDLTPYDVDVNFVVCSKSPDGPIPSPFVLSRDDTAPSEVSVGLFQNPSVERDIDVYVVSEERLYTDLPLNDPSLGAGNEGPEITVTLGDQSQTLIAERSYTDSLVTMYQYRAQFDLWDSGDYSVAVNGQDMTGNVLQTISKTITVRKMLAKTGGTLSTQDGIASLDFAPVSIARDALVTVSMVDLSKSVEMDEIDNGSNVAYRFGPANLQLLKPVRLRWFYNSDRSDSYPAIYRLEDSNWIVLDGQVDPEKSTIEIQIDKLGVYRLGSRSDRSLIEAVPTAFAVTQNYPNPFNATTAIHYQLPEQSQVRLVVYNAIGEQVEVLVDRTQSTGYYTVHWDTKNLASGLYFYVFKADRFTRTKKMVLLK